MLQQAVNTVHYEHMQSISVIEALERFLQDSLRFPQDQNNIVLFFR